MNLLPHLCSFAVGALVGVLVGYWLALRAAGWGIRASTEARTGRSGLFSPAKGSPEVEMAEERERWLSGPTLVPVSEDLDDEEPNER